LGWLASSNRGRLLAGALLSLPLWLSLRVWMSLPLLCPAMLLPVLVLPLRLTAVLPLVAIAMAILPLLAVLLLRGTTRRRAAHPGERWLLWSLRRARGR
jgi:hypothetical protein